MKKLKGFYQNNRIYCILMIVSIVCIILIASAFVYYFIEQTRTDVYGKRLYGIESVKISDDKQKEIEGKIKENEKISKVTFDLKGKIIYLTIELKEGTTEDAQAIAIKSLEYLSTEEKEFYDINFIFTNTAEDDNAKFFPLMGYKKVMQHLYHGLNKVRESRKLWKKIKK